MVVVGDRDDFLAGFDGTWRAAEIALHNGDATHGTALGRSASR